MKTENWKTVRLSDICILEKGQQIDTSLLDDSKPYRYINGGIKESGYFDSFNTSGESVLISEGGASCGYINYVNENFWCGCHCYRLHDIKVFPKYLFHALKANQQRIMALRTGSAMPNIQKSTIQKFELKIHDDSTIQKKVSTMLDKCNELIEKHKMTLEKYDTLIKSRFIEMFGDPRINSKNLPSVKFIDVIKLQRGFDLPVQERDSTGTINVYGSNGVLGKHNEIKVKGPGIVTGRSGTLGKVYYVLEDYWPLNTTLFSVDTHGNNVIYLKYLLEAFELERFTEGAGVPTLNRNIVHEKEIINAPLELQQQFAAFVQQIDKSKFAVQKSLEKAETLYKSLMQEYFG